MALWRDLRRWPSFVEGFGHVVELSGEWPSEGAKLVWQSGPEGRGRVTERVLGSGPDRIATRVYEERLSGEQTFRVREAPQGSLVGLELSYELNSDAPLNGLADLLFIRRALRDSLRRTLTRFAVEAEDEAGLR